MIMSNVLVIVIRFILRDSGPVYPCPPPPPPPPNTPEPDEIKVTKETKD